MERNLYSIDLESNIPPNIFCSLSFNTVKTNIGLNTEISPNFLEQNFCGNVQFPQSFGRITVRFRKVSTPGNLVKSRHFMQQNMMNQDSQGLYFRIYLT